MIAHILQIILRANLWLCVLPPAIVLVVHLVPYFIDSHRIRRNNVEGPFIARFSDTWLAWVTVHGHRSEVVHEMHKSYGTFVRLAPNHVSISDPEALHIVYGHGNGMLKSNFYDAFVSVRPSVFSTRSRKEHARKRKVISHVFSQKSILEFEPHIRLRIAEFLDQWDKLCDGGKKGLTGTEGEGGWKGHSGFVWFNAMPWFNYLGFDIIGDLAFGSPFGMVHNAKDAAPTATDQKAAMAQYGTSSTDTQDLEKPVVNVKEVPAVKVLNSRSDFFTQLAILPVWWRPIVRCLLRQRSQDSEDVAGLAVAAVAKRLTSPTERADILSKLQKGRDEHGMPLSREDLTTDAVTQLVAGSDTVSNTSCAIAYHLIANPRVQAKLQKELDAALGASDDPVATYAQIKHLSYIDAVINEGLRVHSTASLGLPCVVPEAGLTVCGKWFPEDTVLSVPTYTIHRDPKVWGEDADMFRPERWFERDQAVLQKVFNPFSFGPRACIGRNLAMMELQIIIASIFHQYELVLEQPDKPVSHALHSISSSLSCRTEYLTTVSF